MRGLVVKVDPAKGAVVRFFNNLHGLIPVRRLVREYKDIDTALEKLSTNTVLDVKVNKIEIDHNRLELKFHDEAELSHLPPLYSTLKLSLAYKLSRYNSWVCTHIQSADDPTEQPLEYILPMYHLSEFNEISLFMYDRFKPGHQITCTVISHKSRVYDEDYKEYVA